MSFWLLNVQKYYWSILFFLQERDPIKCVIHTTKLKNWTWDDETPNHMLDNYIWQFRLQPLKNISYWNSNCVLISAFVERWPLETNAFHMPFGEMTITLNDVPIDVGIMVMGWSVNTPRGLPMRRRYLLSYLACSRKTHMMSWIWSRDSKIGIALFQVLRCH